MPSAIGKEELLTEESIRELAETYLENPTMVSGGSYGTYYPPVQCYPCEPAYLSPPADMYGGHPLMQPNVYPSAPPQGQYPAAPQQPIPAAQTQAPAARAANPFPIECQNPIPHRKPDCGPTKEGYTINFEDISVIQLIQFISKISGTNYIFNNSDLNFNVTIVSEDQTSVADLSAALTQILQMHNLCVSEQGNNVLIYRNPCLSKVSTVITDDNINDACDAAIITRVFKLFNVMPEKIAKIVKPLLSTDAIVEPSVETGHLIVTDITANINRIADLLNALDTSTLAVQIGEYDVQNADTVTLAEYALHILKPLAAAMSTDISITAEPYAGKIFVVATPYLLCKAQSILASLDVSDVASNIAPEMGLAVSPSVAIENNHFYMYKLKYNDGREIADALREIGTNLQYTGVANIDFVNTIYTLQWIEVNNSIVLTGTEESIAKVVALLDDLDQAPKQVYIEVLVIDTALQNSLDFGVQWIALGNDQNKLAYGAGLLSNTPPNTNIQTPARTQASGTSTSGPPSPPNASTIPLAVPGNLSYTSAAGGDIGNLLEAFSLGILGNVISHNGQSFLTLGALISALDEEQDTSVVLNPKIMVEDTQPAVFFVGQNIPYQTTSTVIQQTGSVTQNIQYEDVGVELQITPTISPNNVVTLQINQTVAEVSGTAGSTNLTPVTNKELISTRVHVPDGTFLVFSGHVRDACNYIRSGIPCLGTLPLIGPAFSRTIEQRTKRNLIFFVRPKVVTNIQEGVCLTNQEGYEYNWNSNPCSLRDGCQNIAPECEFYPAPPLCPPSLSNTRGEPQKTNQNHRYDFYSDHNFDHLKAQGLTGDDLDDKNAEGGPNATYSHSINPHAGGGSGVGGYSPSNLMPGGPLYAPTNAGYPQVTPYPPHAGNPPVNPNAGYPPAIYYPEQSFVPQPADMYFPTEGFPPEGYPVEYPPADYYIPAEYYLPN